MKQKNFLARKKQQRRRKRAKRQVKAFESKEVEFDKLPSLAKQFVARKRRAAARTKAE